MPWYRKNPEIAFTGRLRMNDLERLHLEIAHLLEGPGGILDKLNYNRLRRLGQILHLKWNYTGLSSKDFPAWDFPPVDLQGWIKSYAATIETVQIAEESGLLSVIKPKSREIRELLSPEMIPLLDTYIVPKERIEEMIAHAKGYNKFDDFGFDAFTRNAVSEKDIARVVVVNLDTPGNFPDRPKVDKTVGDKRLQIGALIGKAATGGALAVANFSIGALAFSTLPAIVGNVHTALAVVGSVYTGLAGACDAVEKIAAVVRG